MANPIAGSVTFSSSTAGVSAAIMLDPTARVTAILAGFSGLLLSSGTVGTTQDVTIQGTMDTWMPLGPTQTWSNLSTTHYSSVSGGVLLTWTGPLAGLRIASSNFTVGTAANTVVLTLKALQAVTAGP